MSRAASRSRTVDFKHISQGWGSRFFLLSDPSSVCWYLHAPVKFRHLRRPEATLHNFRRVSMFATTVNQPRHAHPSVHPSILVPKVSARVPLYEFPRNLIFQTFMEVCQEFFLNRENISGTLHEKLGTFYCYRRHYIVFLQRTSRSAYYRIKLICIYYFQSEHNNIIGIYNIYLLIVNYGQLVSAFLCHNQKRA